MSKHATLSAIKGAAATKNPICGKEGYFTLDPPVRLIVVDAQSLEIVGVENGAEVYANAVDPSCVRIDRGDAWYAPHLFQLPDGSAS